MTKTPREAVTLLESNGRPLMQLAAELGIQPSMLRSYGGTANGAMSPTATTPLRSHA